MPGMTLSSDELVEASSGGWGSAGSKTKQVFSRPPGRGECFRSACGLQALYTPEVAGMDGMSVYLGHVDARAVTTAMGYRTGREGAIFSVATPAEHRRHGYGAAITAFATRSLFESGARPRVVADDSYRGARLLPTRIGSECANHMHASPPERLSR